MSNGALDRPTFEAIESYVLDRMDALEREAFEQRLAGDATLRAEVELERENIRAVELGGVARLLKGIAAEDGAQASGTNWARYLKYAAMIAVLISGAIWWSMRPSLNERLFAEYFVADPGLPVAPPPIPPSPMQWSPTRKAITRRRVRNGHRCCRPSR